MIRKNTNRALALLSSIAILLSSCGCVNLTSLYSEHSSSTTDSVTVSSKPAKRVSVSFDSNETFVDEPSRLAAERMDPIIRQAVEILNTMPSDDIKVLDCDYSKRPTARDTLKGDREALDWYDFLYKKLLNVEQFTLNPADYGEDEEALYVPFYTAEAALIEDHGEVFLTGATWAEDNGVIRPIYFMPNDGFDYPCEDLDAVRDAAAVYYCCLDRILEKMPSDLSNYEKSFYFILVISLAAEHKEEYIERIFAPYDTLVVGKTVCRGFAQTFAELCRRSEISAWYCVGYSPDGQRHAWNRIDTTDGPRYIDVTCYDGSEVTTHYRQGDFQYLFMTQQDYDRFGYREDAKSDK